MKSFLIFIFLYTAIRVHSCKMQYDIADSEVHQWGDVRSKDADYSKIIIYIPKQDEIATLPDEFPIFDKIQKTLFSFFDKISKPRDDIHAYEAVPRCNKLIHSLRTIGEEIQRYPTNNNCEFCSNVANSDRNSEMKPNVLQILQTLFPIEKDLPLPKPTLEEQPILKDDVSTERNQKNELRNYMDLEGFMHQNFPEHQIGKFETDKKKRSLDNNVKEVDKKYLSTTLINQGKSSEATANLVQNVKFTTDETTVENKDTDNLVTHVKDATKSTTVEYTEADSKKEAEKLAQQLKRALEKTTVEKKNVDSKKKAESLVQNIKLAPEETAFENNAADSEVEVENLGKHLKGSTKQTTVAKEDEKDVEIDRNFNIQSVKQAIALEHNVMKEQDTEIAINKAKRTTKVEDKKKPLNAPHSLLHSANNFFPKPKVPVKEPEHIQIIPKRRPKREEIQLINPLPSQDEIEEPLTKLGLASKK